MLEIHQRELSPLVDFFEKHLCKNGIERTSYC